MHWCKFGSWKDMSQCNRDEHFSKKSYNIILICVYIQYYFYIVDKNIRIIITSVGDYNAISTIKHRSVNTGKLSVMSKRAKSMQTLLLKSMIVYNLNGAFRIKISKHVQIVVILQTISYCFTYDQEISFSIHNSRLNINIILFKG